MSIHEQQLAKARTGAGFIAALDQSGGSTPKALAMYGVSDSEYNGDDEMFAKVHAMRTRIITNSAFSGERILGAILFENTMQREIQGMPSAQYLWEVKQVIPILKVDKGLADEADGVQVMKPMPELDSLLKKATAHNIFGTKMRSVIKTANANGIAAVVAQQFEIAEQIIAHGLVPIIEPEVDIHSPQKSEAEQLLKKELAAHLESLDDGKLVMLKLTLPESANFYAEFVSHPRCLKVAALSGGYSRAQACQMLRENSGMVASFSRGLTEGLSVQQSDAEFTSMLDESIATIFAASAT